jgi:hypothetical protein
MLNAWKHRPSEEMRFKITVGIIVIVLQFLGFTPQGGGVCRESRNIFSKSILVISGVESGGWGHTMTVGESKSAYLERQ